MDIFVEQIVKRKMGPIDALVIVGVILAALVVISLPLWIPPLFMLWLLLIAGACFGVYYLIGMRMWEFEYSVTNGDLTCDKIIQRRRRKRQFSIDLHAVSEIGKYDPQKFQNRRVANTYFVGTTAKGAEGDWYLQGEFEQYGPTLIVFSPSERVLEAIKPALKRSVLNEAFPRGTKRVQAGD